MEVCRAVCDKIAVMEKGQIVEENTAEGIFTNPKHPVTKSFVRGEDFTELDEVVEELPATIKTKNLVTLNFKKSSAGQPIVSQAIKATGVDINILSGKINKLAHETTGYLTVEITGNKDQVDEALAFFDSQDLIVEEV